MEAAEVWCKHVYARGCKIGSVSIFRPMPISYALEPKVYVFASSDNEYPKFVSSKGIESELSTFPLFEISWQNATHMLNCCRVICAHCNPMVCDGLEILRHRKWLERNEGAFYRCRSLRKWSECVVQAHLTALVTDIRSIDR